MAKSRDLGLDNKLFSCHGHHGSPCKGGIWSFLMPSLSFTEVSVNNITTKEMEVKGFLAALIFSFKVSQFCMQMVSNVKRFIYY